MNERGARESAPTAAEPLSPDGLATPSAPNVTNEPNLPPIAAHADDLEAIKKAVDDAAAVGGALWLSYLFVLFYLAVAAGAVTHADLFFENPVKLPFLNIELPLLAFFFLAPILFLIVHAYTLVHLVMLTDKAKRFHQELHEQIRRQDCRESRERCGGPRRLRRQLPSKFSSSFSRAPGHSREPFRLAPARDRLGDARRRADSPAAADADPIPTVSQHLHHMDPAHRIGVDLVLLWWLWRKILSGREPDDRRPRCHLGAGRSSVSRPQSLRPFVLGRRSTTFPGEWQDDRFAGLECFPTTISWKPTSPFTIGSSTPRSMRQLAAAGSRSRARSSAGLNVYEGLDIDDPEKVKWRDFIFRARGRDLKGANFDFANLPKVDFTGAHLQGASLDGAELQGASLDDAQLQGASLDDAQLQGASLDDAQLQGASLERCAASGRFIFQAAFALLILQNEFRRGRSSARDPLAGGRRSQKRKRSQTRRGSLGPLLARLH